MSFATSSSGESGVASSGRGAASLGFLCVGFSLGAGFGLGFAGVFDGIFFGRILGCRENGTGD